MSKELDKHLKEVIKKVPETIQNFLDDSTGETELTYYVGNWQEDVLNNFTTKQSEKIFAEMRLFQDKVHFLQRKMNFEYEMVKNRKVETVGSYEYIVRKKTNNKRLH